jgi:hypothetical protein
MYSGDEEYGDDITSGLSYEQRMGRAIKNAPKIQPHGSGPLGSVLCHFCAKRADVIYPYSNSKVEIGIQDHESEAGTRCRDAGRTLARNGQWLYGSGYTIEEVTFTVPVATIHGAAE